MCKQSPKRQDLGRGMILMKHGVIEACCVDGGGVRDV